MIARKPDFIIGKPDNPYLLRWYLIPRNKVFNIYLHKFLKSDDDRALHDHPWIFNLSLIIKGKYLEYKPGGIVKNRHRFIPYLRIGEAPHRVVLINNQPVWTVFITGLVVREWGFYCPSGWKHWKEFTKKTDNGNETGKGCE